MSNHKVSKSIYMDRTVLRRLTEMATREDKTLGDIVSDLVAGEANLTDNQVTESLTSLKEEVNGLRRSLDFMMEFNRMCMKILFRRIPGNNMLVRDCVENRSRKALSAEELAPIQEENDRLLQFCLNKSGENVARFYWDDITYDPFPDEVFVKTLQTLMESKGVEVR